MACQKSTVSRYASLLQCWFSFYGGCKVTRWIVAVRKRVFGSPDNFLTPVARGMDNKTKVHGEHSRERGAEPALLLSGFGSVNSFLSCSII